MGLAIKGLIVAALVAAGLTFKGMGSTVRNIVNNSGSHGAAVSAAALGHGDTVSDVAQNHSVNHGVAVSSIAKGHGAAVSSVAKK